MVARKLLVVLLLVLFGVHANCQEKCACDSIDEELYEKYNNDEKYDSAYSLVEKFKNKKNTFCQALYYRSKADISLRKNQFDTALFYYEKEAGTLSLVCDSSVIIPSLLEITRCYFRLSQREEALTSAVKVLALAEQYNDTVHILGTYSFMALLFNMLGQPKKALQYCWSMQLYLDKLPLSDTRAFQYNSLSSRYLHIYQDTKDHKYFDSSKYYAQKGHRDALEINDRSLLVTTYTKLSGLEFYEQNTTKALAYLDTARIISNPETDMTSLYTIHGDIAHIYMDMSRYNNAKKHADSCLYYAQKAGTHSAVMNAYALIYQCGKKSEDYMAALAAIEDYINIKDSVETVEKHEVINELEEKYNRAKNEKTIKELNQEKQISELKIKFLTAGILFTILVVVAVFLFYRQQMLKKKNEHLEIEQRLNRARLNPHLFFNSLTAIQGYALREKDIPSVAVYLSKQANIMRITLESTYKELVSIEDEVDFLTQYLDTQLLLYKDVFEYDIEIGEDIDVSEVALPGMILQPFIENSIEHGFAGIDYKGKMNIIFAVNKAGLNIIINDNGKGIAHSTDSKKYPSRATQIIKDRLLLLNRQYRSKAFYNIDSAGDIQGTVVNIQLPLIYINESSSN